MPAIRLTAHSVERLKERLGLPRAACVREAQRAYDSGLSHGEARGKLKRWLDGMITLHGPSNYRLRGRFVFVFGYLTLITVLELPHEFERTVDKLSKR